MTNTQQENEHPNLNKLTKAQLLEHIEILEAAANCRVLPAEVTGEYPVSFHTKYKANGGFECNLFVRGFTGNEVLGDAAKALEYLKKNGAEPWQYSRNGKSANEKKICPIHKVPLKRFEKNGSSWYSHIAYNDDGSEFYCKGKVKKEQANE